MPANIPPRPSATDLISLGHARMRLAYVCKLTSLDPTVTAREIVERAVIGKPRQAEYLNKMKELADWAEREVVLIWKTLKDPSYIPAENDLKPLAKWMADVTGRVDPYTIIPDYIRATVRPSNFMELCVLWGAAELTFRAHDAGYSSDPARYTVICDQTGKRVRGVGVMLERDAAMAKATRIVAEMALPEQPLAPPPEPVPQEEPEETRIPEPVTQATDEFPMIEPLTMPNPIRTDSRLTWQAEPTPIYTSGGTTSSATTVNASVEELMQTIRERPAPVFVAPDPEEDDADNIESDDDPFYEDPPVEEDADDDDDDAHHDGDLPEYGDDDSEPEYDPPERIQSRPTAHLSENPF